MSDHEGTTPDNPRLRDAITQVSSSAESGDRDALAERELLFVRVVADLFAFPVEYLIEVLAPSRVTPVPHVPAHITGVVAHHGIITAVLDLARLCNKEPEENPRRLLVLRSGDLEAAVPVSEIIGLHSVLLENVEPPLPHARAERPFVNGQITRDEDIFSVVDPEALLRGSRHKKQKASSG